MAIHSAYTVVVPANVGLLLLPLDARGLGTSQGNCFCQVGREVPLRVGQASARDVRRVPFLLRISQRRRETSPCWQERSIYFVLLLAGRTGRPACGCPDVPARRAPRLIIATPFAA